MRNFVKILLYVVVFLILVEIEKCEYWVGKWVLSWILGLSRLCNSFFWIEVFFLDGVKSLWDLGGKLVLYV